MLFIQKSVASWGLSTFGQNKPHDSSLIDYETIKQVLDNGKLG